MTYHKTVLGDTTCFLHEDHRIEKRKGNRERYAAYKEKDRVRKRESRKKALSPRTATVEMEIQRKSELVNTSCKRNEISQNGLGDTTCFLRRSFQTPEQPTVEKLFKVIRRHKRVSKPFYVSFEELREMTVNVQKN